MERNDAECLGNSQPNIPKSSGTGEKTSQKQPNPVTAEINAARKVWEAEGRNNPAGRVADAGDGGQTVPYEIETEANSVARQSAGQSDAAKDIV